MGLSSKLRPDGDTFEQLAGITGVGWTASALGFLGTVIGYGNGLVSRLVADPQSLLYLGTLFFLTTLGLDRLAGALGDETQYVGNADAGESPSRPDPPEADAD